MEIRELICHLIALDKKRHGEKHTPHEKKRLYQWVFEECKLRWPHIAKREVWNILQDIKNESSESTKRT